MTNGIESGPARHGRLPYQQPVLIEFGTLREMTLSVTDHQGSCDNPGKATGCNNKTS